MGECSDPVRTAEGATAPESLRLMYRPWLNTPERGGAPPAEGARAGPTRGVGSKLSGKEDGGGIAVEGD